ncbi:sensor histidine kinase [Mobilicoccus caccae]|uniref:histidine kinase n=1 Tax=Mobilicoccus caccae TaxID=1859295 RepID=A0ABQ6IT96_9MICO|nr:HAMP domain-containing sensor histidine kinase [Mobilicoccus caccae]GMA41150.1 two-component sensor histidine kinase [Mobilicoccus caccae]
MSVSGVVVGSPEHPRRSGVLSGWTLRRTLVTPIVALFALVTLLSGVGMSYLLENALQRELDHRVASTARGFGPDDPGRGPEGQRRRVVGPDMLAVVVDGSVVRTNTVATRGGQREALNEQQIRALLQAGLSEQPSTLDLGEPLGPYRLIAFSTPEGAQVVTGLPLDPMLDSVRRVRLITVGLGLLGFVVVGLGTAWVVGRALRPLERVAATATRVSQVPLSSGEVSVTERVPLRDTDRRTEVGQVGAALNDLLEHVDSALRVRQEGEARLRRFVADASHELRTPLSSIRGYTELSMRDPELPSDVRRSLTRVDSESHRMADLVEDLLLLARLDAGRPLAREPVDLTRLLIDTVSDARAAGPGHQWRLDLPEDAVEVTGDGARLTQVLVNLLANARTHTPAGTTVTGRVRREGSGVLLEVEDDGPGIDPALVPTVFERFSRGDSARTRAGTSTGLGLSIVEAVVGAHGGSVHVDSRPGRTRFTLRLPAATTDD